MIKACIFDIDNTLYSYDLAHAPAYRAVSDYACAAFDLTPERFDALHQSANRTLRAHAGENCAAIHNRLIRYQLLLEELGQPLSHAPKMTELYWSTLLSHMRPYPGMAECLARLKETGHTVGIGTNMTADYQFAKLARLGVLDIVDFVVSSEEAGAEKPDKRFFDCCVEKAGCRAEGCLFVGDDLQNDVLGAKQAGMRAVWLCPEPATQAPAVEHIRSLAELPDLIEHF